MTQLLIRMFIKDSKDIESSGVREKYGTLCSGVSIACNLVLCIIKISAGLISASISVVADGLNNLSDMGSSLISMIGFKLAGKPADRDHPYGHGRMEYLSAFIVAVLIIYVGIELFRKSVGAIIDGDAAPVHSIFSIIVLCISVVLKFWMFTFNRQIGKKINSEVLIATAQDSVNDVIATSVILLSVLVSTFIDLPFNLDAVMGIGVAVFIIFSGLKTGKDTIDIILGGPPDPKLISDITSIIDSFDGFYGIHDLIIHNYGPGRLFASVHVEVPNNVNVVECHEKIDLCEKLVCERLGVQLVIHMDPIETDNAEVNKTRETLAQALLKIDARLTLHDFRMTPHSENRTNLIFDVVVPSDCEYTKEQLKLQISKIAYDINKTYCCVITFDNDYTGK